MADKADKGLVDTSFGLVRSDFNVLLADKADKGLVDTSFGLVDNLLANKVVNAVPTDPVADGTVYINTTNGELKFYFNNTAHTYYLSSTAPG